MSYALAQVDPTPPPVRPLNWPMILGWTAVVGVTLAIFNGTINLGGSHVRANRRRKRKRRMTRNAGRRSTGTRPKRAKMSELGVWEAIGTVREAHPHEHLNVLPPGVAAKFKKLPPGLYKYGYGPKKGEVITQFKKATLKGAMTSTRIGASKVGEYHWVVDNFDPKFPVVVRGIDDHGKTYFRIEEYAKNFERVPVYAQRKSSAR